MKKRGLPEGYVRGMEKLWGVAITEVDGIEERMLNVTLKDGNNHTTGFQNVWNDEGNSEVLLEAWNKSSIARELNRLLTLSDTQAEHVKRKRTTSFFPAEKRTDWGSSNPVDEGVNSVWNAPRIDIQPHVQEHPDDLPVIYDDTNQHPESHFESILSPTNPRPASRNTNASPLISDLPSEAWHLLDVYFSYTHSWLPIIDKLDLLRTSYQYSQNRHDILLIGPGSGNHAALWAAIAYSKFQHRAINNIPHAQGEVAEMVWTAEKMYTQARSFIPNEEGYFELGHVQALLILTLTNLGIGHLSRAWLLIGQAVRLALDLRLHGLSDDVLAPLKPKSRDKHVFLGCFVLETLIAARLGRHPHLRSEDAERLGQVEEDGLEEWDPWTDCLSVRKLDTGNVRSPASILSTFNRLIHVVQILNEATYISENAKQSQQGTVLLEKLHIWSQKQSSPLYFDTTAMRTDQAKSILPNQYNLHLAYFTTFSVAQLLCYDHGKQITNLEPSTRSARQIVALLQQHSINFGLLMVPPTFEYFTKTAYAVVQAVNESAQSTHIMLNDWKHNLNNCLNLMGPAWPVFETLKTVQSIQTNSPANDRSQTDVAFDLISGIRQVRNAPQPTKNINFDYNVTHKANPKVTPSHVIQGNLSPSSHRTSSFTQSNSPGLVSNTQHNPQSPFSSNAWLSLSQRQPFIPPQNRSTGSFQSEYELDPAFQEFVTMDATKWYYSHSFYCEDLKY